MQSLLMITLTSIILIFPSALFGAEDAYAGKKLINFGWGGPSTTSLRERVRELEKVPFDGVVITVPSKTRNTTLGWHVFSKVKIQPEEYEHAIEDLKATKFERFTDNFIHVTGMPGDVGWFDPEWPAVAHNAAALARVAKQGGCKGILFDPESYGGYYLWSYARQSAETRAAHSFEAYVAKVKERGKEFIRAVSKEYPDISILAIFGPSMSYGFYQVGLPWGEYSLLYAFYDGMCEAAEPGMRIHDGYEQAYGFRERSQYQDGRTRTKVLTRDRLSSNPKAYDEHVRAGFAVWADNSCQSFGWFPDDLSKNYYTPDQFRNCLAYALEASDEYVWVYNEYLRWWDGSAPEPFVNSLLLAKQGPE